VACLYVAHGDHGGRAVVKFGITKYDDPDNRLAAHGKSKDTPFGAPVQLRLLLGVTMERWHARDIESVIKRATRAWFPEADSYSFPDVTSLIGKGPVFNPSGEWLFGPDAWPDFLAVARGAVQDACAKSRAPTREMATMQDGLIRAQGIHWAWRHGRAA
jgi:hypothetical protein